MAARTASNGIILSLANLPATPRQGIFALAAAIVLVIAFAIAAPFAATPLPRLDAAIPTLAAMIFVNDLITSVLLFGQYIMFPSIAILVLAGGYFFTALIVIPYALTFPGAFAPTGLLGADLQSPAWLYNFWHIGLPAAIFAYAVLKDADRLNTRGAHSAWFAISSTIAIIIGLVSLITWATIALKQFLPPLFFATAIQLRTVSVSYIVAIQLLVAAVTLAALWMRRRSVLDYWLMLVICAFVSEELLFGLFSARRFSLGWYAGRAFALATSMFVLVLLLAEITRLYAGLARTNVMLERERENRLMNVRTTAASITHEIRQPLSSIWINCDAALGLLEMPAPDVAGVRAALNDIRDGVHHANEVLHGIHMLFARVDQGQQLVDVNEVALEVLHTLRGELSECGVTAFTELTATMPFISGNRSQLKEVFYNLIHNAVEAMATTTGQSRRLLLKTERRDADAITVAVQDSGPGIDPTKINEMFDAFVTTKPHGMGLGLAICRTIIENHGGRLSASSDGKNGALLQFVLPVNSTDEATAHL